MENFICYDLNGQKIKYLYQWDVNQFIKIAGNDINEKSLTIHFSNRNMNNALVVKPTISDNFIIVSIPNIILTTRENLQVYIYEEYDNNNDNTIESGRTICTIHIPIRPRQKPDDYFYSNNVEYISVKNTLENAVNFVDELKKINRKRRI